MDGIQNGKRRSQIIISITSVLALFVLSTVYGLSQINSIGADLKEIAESYIPLTKIITNIEAHQLEQSVLFERALRLGENMAAKAENQRQLNETLKKYEGYAGKVDEELKNGVKMAENAIQAAHTEEERKSFDDIGERLRKFAQEHQDIDHHAGEVFKLLQQGRLREAHTLLETVDREKGQSTHEMETFLIRVEELTEQAALSAEYSEEQAYLWMLVLTAFAFSAIPAALRVMRNSGP